MLDLKFVIEYPDEIRENLKKRGLSDQFWIVDEVIADYKKWKELKKETDDIRHERNQVSLEIAKLKKAKKDASKVHKKASKLIEDLKVKEEECKLFKDDLDKKLMQLPNILHASVPEGKDEKDNPEVKKVGKPKKFSFDLVNHAELAEQLGVADFDMGRKVAGQGFNYLKGELAELDLALQRYGIDFLIEKGFTVVVPPVVLNRKTLGGAVNLADFEEVIYKVENEDLHLIGTAEHALVSMLSGKMLQQKELPLKFCAVTPCFRKEIGSRGVDTKGLFRMHQFNKVEQVVFAQAEDSFRLLEEMQKITEEFFKSLEIPFRVIEICAGDLGPKFAKQYDIESWSPRQEEYKEITSAGNCTDYQSRKLNIKYTNGKEKEFVHILNNTMVATSRAMVAILENFQKKDGSVEIPKVLHKYLRFTKIKAKK